MQNMKQAMSVALKILGLREETTHDPKCHTDKVVHLDESKVLTSHARKNVWP